MLSPTSPFGGVSSERKGGQRIRAPMHCGWSIRAEAVQSKWAGLLVRGPYGSKAERVHGTCRRRQLLHGRRWSNPNSPKECAKCRHGFWFFAARAMTVARSLDKNGNECDQLECAAVCEYGFKLGDDGCHTCKCDDPCDGYTCPEDEECVNVKEISCSGFLCPSLPVCK